jgi:glycosyltransferase involved in cell wall biosynthesis
MGERMSISAGTFCLNPLELDYPIIEWVKTALEFSDQVVIVDAGSTDGTVEKLKTLDSRVEVHQIVWQYKFKRWSPTNHAEPFIRNNVLKHCKKDWIFFSDADEIIHEKFHSKIKEMVQVNKYDMYDIWMAHLYRCRRDGRYQITLKTLEKTGIKRRPMLYRNHLGIFYGRLRKNSHCPHQELVASGKSRAPAINRLRVCRPSEEEISAIHYGQCRFERCVARSLNLWGIRYEQNDNFKGFDEEKHILEDRGYPLFTGEHPSIMQGWLHNH